MSTPWPIPWFEALGMVVKQYRLVFNSKEVIKTDSLTREDYYGYKPCELVGQGVYVFLDYCKPDKPFERPGRGQDNVESNLRRFHVIRNIGETNTEFYERLRYKDFMWDEAWLIFMKKSASRRNQPAINLQNYLLERFQTTHNTQLQVARMASDVFDSQVPSDEVSRQKRASEFAFFHNPTVNRSRK